MSNTGKSSERSSDPKLSAEAYFEWLASEEGQAHAKEAEARSLELRQKLEADSRIDWKSLYEPFTI
jgi:hypothetical protein